MFVLQIFSRILTPSVPWSIRRWSAPILRCPMRLGLWGLLCCSPRSIHCRLLLRSHKFCNLSLALFKSSHWLLMFQSLPSRRFFGCYYRHCCRSACLACSAALLGASCAYSWTATMSLWVALIWNSLTCQGGYVSIAQSYTQKRNATIKNR